MYIDLIIEKTLKESKLKRVRIKVDPSELAVFGYENVSSFEGYILEEGLATVRVYMVGVPPGINPIQTVDKEHVTTVEPPPISPKFLEFKSRVLQQLEKEGIQKDAPQYTQIQNSNNPEFIETYLKELKFDDRKIADLYKSIFLSEGILDKIATGAAKTMIKKNKFGQSVPLGNRVGSALKQLADNPLIKIGHAGVSAVAAIPGLIIGKNNILNRVSRFMRSFDLNDLINLNKVHPIFVNNNREIQINNKIITRFGNVDLVGTVVQETRTGWNVRIQEPEKYKGKVVQIDHSLLGPGAGKGTLYFDNKKYRVKVRMSGGNVLLTVIKDLDKVADNTEEIRKNIETKTIDKPEVSTTTGPSDKERQDTYRAKIHSTLEASFPKEKPSDYTKLLNNLTLNILKEEGREESKFQKFVDVVSKTNEEINELKEKTGTSADLSNKLHTKLLKNLENSGFNI